MQGTSMRLFCLFIIGFVLTCGSILNNDICHAQGGDAKATQTKEDNPIVLSVRQSDPKSIDDLAQAVQVMVDIGRLDEAKVYLQRLLAAQATDAQWYQLQRKFSTAFLLDLTTRPALAPENRQYADKIIAVIKKINSDPMRLNNLVKDLSNVDEVKRAQAIADLQNVGPPAVAAILSAMADDNRKSEHKYLFSTLRRMGSNAEGPLCASILSPSRRVRVVAADQLASMESPVALQMLLVGWINSENDATMRKICERSLKKLLRRIPTKNQIYTTVFRSAQDYLYNRVTMASDANNQAWVWDWKNNALVGTKVALHVASREEAFRRATALFKGQPEKESYQRLYGICYLGSAKSRGGLSRSLKFDLVDDQRFKDVAYVERVLVDALDSKRMPAAVAACEILAKIGDASLVRSTNGRFRPLVRALTFGELRLQIAATETIMKLGPTEAYPGSSHLTRSLMHIVNSTGRPKTIVGHVQPAEGQNMVAALQRVGLDGELATSSKQLFRKAVLQSDVEFLMVSDTLDWPDYAELVQQLRHDWRTRRTPIAIVTRQENRRRVQRIARTDPLLIGLSWTTDESLLARQIDRLISLNGINRVGGVERSKAAYEAAHWIAKISADPKLSKIYQLANHQNEIATAMISSEMSPILSAVVGRFGTPSAQKALLTVINDSGQPNEYRIAAADAFAASVKKHGTLLTTREIKTQYGRYNASEFETKESQAVLGRVLDVIEARGKKK